MTARSSMSVALAGDMPVWCTAFDKRPDQFLQFLSLVRESMNKADCAFICGNFEESEAILLSVFQGLCIDAGF
ncbi:MAG: hypothetical protein KZQ97_11195 [Candidatus Thiodiazotropha sp. (ex Dulcina madagascariensis)]|nr:hypothetical protein [Candidatus Thiodiazotropha sp. (ex Dulcina madagascariensis)]